VETDEAKRKDYARQAVEHLNKALEIYPNYKDAYMSRGGSLYLLENYPEALADYRRAWQLAPGDTRVKSALALVLRDGGKYFGEKKGDLATAMQYLTEAWQLNTKDPETARLLGVANGVQGKNADAIMWFGKAVELAPDNASYLFDLGTATAIGGDVVRGEEMRQRALQMDPELIKKRNQ
jgi:tetratricopeptide (TPR) repeat protein